MAFDRIRTSRCFQAIEPLRKTWQVQEYGIIWKFLNGSQGGYGLPEKTGAWCEVQRTNQPTANIRPARTIVSIGATLPFKVCDSKWGIGVPREGSLLHTRQHGAGQPCDCERSHLFQSIGKQPDKPRDAPQVLQRGFFIFLKKRKGREKCQAPFLGLPFLV